jgi:hypothetical protein
MCDLLNKNKKNQIKNKLSPSEEINKHLMIITVSQLMEKNLIAPTNGPYKIFKKLIQTKNPDISDLTELYKEILHESINNDFFNSEDTQEIILEIFEEVDHYKSEYLLTSQQNKSEDVFNKLKDVLKIPFL